MSPAPDLAPILALLRDDLGYRRIRAGIERLESLRPQIEAISPDTPDGGTFLGLIAQWVDAGFDCPDLLARLLPRFPAASRAALPLAGYLHLRMVEGVVAMAREDFDGAISHFGFVHSLENEIADQELMAIANFWIGRCLRKLGRYDEA